MIIPSNIANPIVIAISVKVIAVRHFFPSCSPICVSVCSAHRHMKHWCAVEGHGGASEHRSDSSWLWTHWAGFTLLRYKWRYEDSRTNTRPSSQVHKNKHNPHFFISGVNGWLQGGGFVKRDTQQSSTVCIYTIKDKHTDVGVLIERKGNSLWVIGLH